MKKPRFAAYANLGFENLMLNNKMKFFISFLLSTYLSFFLAEANEIVPDRKLIYPEKSWSKIENPEKIGWSSKKLDQAKKYFESTGNTALMIVDDGRAVAEWGDVAQRINCHSVRKSFVSALYGIYSDRGEIDLYSSLQQLNIDDEIEPGLTELEKHAWVIDLLKSRSGIYHPAAYEAVSMKKKRPERANHAPGTYWYYNNWDFNALGTIFKKVTGSTVFQSFQKSIAIPVGMEDFRLIDTKLVYETISSHPSYPFWMSSRDRARFGLLYLRGGYWRGEKIIPSKWIKDSTTAYSNAGPGVGYGYMWWVSVDGWHLGNRMGEAYSARGAKGQYIVVIPRLDLVVVQSNTNKKITGSFNKLLKLILKAKGVTQQSVPTE